MFSFYWPWLILLLPLPFVVQKLLHARQERSENEQELAFPYLEKLQAAFAGQEAKNKNSDRLYDILLSLLWVCLVLAAMQPQFVDKFTKVNNKGYDLMLAVDLSGSMRALDFSTDTENIDRLTVTKKVVSEFVKQREGDRMGLVLFGQNAYLQVPLTLDSQSVIKMLNNAAIGMAGDSTAIGDAIGLAIKNLRDRPKDSRVIILLTDGDDNSSSIPPMQAATLAKQYGIRIYTIGVGSDGEVPFTDGHGNVVMARVTMDETMLKDIAAKTNGSYFRATDEAALAEIYKRINSLEKTDAEAREYMIRDPLYRYPLALAMLLVISILGLPFYRRCANGTV
jgi:Ca-activated chloride channel family protein